MQLEPADVEESLDRLRGLGAVGMVEGYGRVQKYRHYLYEWLGVDKVELAVMTELLLRGDQTVGELRGRAARMEPIADLAALQPVLDSLKAKGLVIGLDAGQGRGHVVTHALYKPREIEALRAKYQLVGAGHAVAPRHAQPRPVGRHRRRIDTTPRPRSGRCAMKWPNCAIDLGQLQDEQRALGRRRAEAPARPWAGRAAQSQSLCPWPRKCLLPGASIWRLGSRRRRAA